MNRLVCETTILEPGVSKAQLGGLGPMLRAISMKP